MTQSDIFNPPLPDSEKRVIRWMGLPGSSAGLALSNAISKAKAPMLIVVGDNLTASHLHDELVFFSGNPDIALHFPDWETLPYDHFSPHQDLISERLTVLNRLPQMTSGAVITTIDTIMHRLPPLDYLAAHSLLVRVGETLNIDIFRTRLTHAGYRSVSQVREHGEFAIRGSIIDIYPMGSKTPYRIDLFDDEIDSIRLFSPESQRSTDKVDNIHLLPGKEFPLTEASIEQFRQRFRTQFGGNPLACPTYQDISDGIASPGIEYYLPLFFDSTTTLFDHIPSHTMVVTLGELNHKATEFEAEINARYEQQRYDTSRPLLPPQQLFLTPNEIKSCMGAYKQIVISDTRSDNDFAVTQATTLDINHKANPPLAPLDTYLQSSTDRVLFCAESMGRREVLLQLFKTINFNPTYFHSWQAFLDHDDKHGIIVAPLEEGFRLTTPALTVFTENHLYGNRVMQRRLRKKAALDPDSIIRDLTELKTNDPVVHIDHGVGRYLGLETLNAGDQLNEFLCLEYQGGDKLYVPVASLHLISRYTGTNPEHTPINKLGTDQWQKAKKRAAEKVRDVAAELLDLYAKRAAREGESCLIDAAQYASFAAGFPFEETPDQSQAIDNVMADMASTRPMDRVICGDVGFGKTEVAMRAAYLAVQNNKQVAVLVPTTLLAQQHFTNFQDRFADWPIQIELLSRFRTAKQTKDALTKLENGKVDIVIGTHKLIQDTIKFKSLGLIIIDEEHRFGVKQKEKLKALRTQVDMLTLTATPIPRTLNMGLAGIRDLSIIATPPAKRLSVKTFVHEFQEQIIYEAITREIMRGGQVYFLHNDIATIEKMAETIKRLFPEARTVVAHGQMHERDLEQVMSEFYHRHYNVLVCSTIIESGIDIPTANTIIINRADKFGIAQLHQLRGRVGRSHHQAYAYLLTPEKAIVSNDAKKRLDAISAYDDLGVGFTLATHDLEIRGAGELLGEEQSGNMQEIGFSLYMDLLSRAVEALKEGKEPDYDKALINTRSDIDLHITALIPETYLPDVQLRLSIYKRISNAKTTSELDEIQVDMIDRFGLIPDPLKNLFAISELKLKADSLGITKIDASTTGGKIEFNEKPSVKPETIIKLIQPKTSSFKLDGPTRLRFTLDKHETTERITLVNSIINLLME